MSRIGRISPDPSLVAWASGWLLLAVASVPLIGLRPLVPIAGLLLVSAALADVFLLLREEEPTLFRTVPEKGAREREEEIVLTVRNPLPRPLELELCEAVPRDLVSPEPIWQSLSVEAGADLRIGYVIRPCVRGERIWGRAVALVRSPFGLWRRRIESPEGDRILVQPETARYLRPEALDPQRVLAALGVRPKRARGEGLEFDHLRDYVIGDEPRRIDWPATARRGRPVVRTFRQEESRTILLAVDRSRLMGTRSPSGVPGDPGGEGDAAQARAFAPTKLDRAVDTALALVFASLAAGDRVGLLVFDRAVARFVAPLAHRASLGRFVDALSDVQPGETEADYRRVTREILSRQKKRAMIVVLTDFMEVDREELIEPMSLLARRHEVIFVALREPILEQLEEEGIGDGASRKGNAKDRRVDLYRRIVLADLLREREGRLVLLRRQGLAVLDVLPGDAIAGTLNLYMTLRHGLRPGGG